MMPDDEPKMDRAMDALLTKVGDEWARAAAPKADDFLARFDAKLAAEPPVARIVPIWRRGGRRLLAAGIAAAVLIAAGGIAYNSTRAVAALAFREGDFRMPEKLRAGAVVEARAGAAGVLAIDGRRVAVHVRELSNLRIESDTKVVLDRGEIWCDVVTNSGRFEVLTPQGSVTVTGTKFGVAVDETGTRVLLHEGRVIVRGARDGNAMTPGTQATISPNADAPVFSNAPESVQPAWSKALLQRAAEDAATRYYPSGAPGRN
jgi:ferric-dicitrate binding protein FerR (iron transport regulator)